VIEVYTTGCLFKWLAPINAPINGYAGNDTLSGGAGDDNYTFGTSTGVGESDTLLEFSDSGRDTLNFGAVTTAVTLNLASTIVQNVHVG
jgi:Ca2+-binding RTX toxin-like protein